MSIELDSRSITRVGLIDDDADVRAMYGYHVEEISAIAHDVMGPITGIEPLLRDFNNRDDAFICDYNLKIKSYSSINGDEIVASLYRLGYPAILCTRFDKHLPEEVRRQRRNIPVVLSPNALTSEAITESFRLCADELIGKFTEERKPRKTLVRIEGGEVIGTNQIKLNMIIPAWDSSIGVSFELPINGSEVLTQIRDRLPAGEIIRIYATVNLGAENPEDVFVDDWTLRD